MDNQNRIYELEDMVKEQGKVIDKLVNDNLSYNKFIEEIRQFMSMNDSLLASEYVMRFKQVVGKNLRSL